MPKQKRLVIWLSFSDASLAKAIADSNPPKGVTVSKPSTLIQCSDPAEMFTQIVISFAANALFAVVAWMVKSMKKGGKKTDRINRQQVVFQNKNILRLIKKQLASQKARDAQWKREHKKPAKKHR